MPSAQLRQVGGSNYSQYHRPRPTLSGILSSSCFECGKAVLTTTPTTLPHHHLHPQVLPASLLKTPDFYIKLNYD